MIQIQFDLNHLAARLIRTTQGSRLRPVVSGLGVATLCCLWVFGSLVTPSHRAVYHWSGTASNLFIPAILQYLLVWFFFWLLLMRAQGQKPQSFSIWVAVVLFLPPVALKSFSLFLDWHLSGWIYSSLASLSGASFILFLFRLKQLRRSALNNLRAAAERCLGIAAACGVLFLVQLVWFGWQARNLNLPQPLHTRANAALIRKPGVSRVIWIVLDELSYRQVYEHRFHTVNLPAFDRLAKQSTVFTDVIPAGVATEEILPSLMLGVSVDKMQSFPDGNGLEIHDPLTNNWREFDPQNTIFGDALVAGFTTSVAGWYNPYCRILARVLDQCYWAYSNVGPNWMLPEASIAHNIINPLFLNSTIMNHLPHLFTNGKSAQDIQAEAHLADVRQLTEASDKLLQGTSSDFILLHMPFPHPGGVYNRASHTLVTRHATYLDNLALADEYLAHVQTLLEADDRWNSSAIVIMGDHSWRTTLLWAGMPGWTPEEQQASDNGQFDERPAYIVKLPEQQVGSTIAKPFAAVDTRRLLQAIIERQIVSSQDLAVWVDKLDLQRSSNQFHRAPFNAP